MSRYRLHPKPAREEALLGHCAHARYLWNLAVEQRSWWQPGRPAPGFATQCRQLSGARAAFPWLAAGSVIVQQQALRDFHAAWASYFAALREWRRGYVRTAPDERPDPPGQPSWRKRGLDEGFRVVATGPQDVQRLNRRWAQVLVPKLGWVRFRWSRPVPEARSYRVTRDRAVFRCRSCGNSANADLNAARNIAAGHAARGGQGLPRPSNREPQLPTFHVA